MCGIAGLIHIGDKHVLRRMAESLSHRGPDDSGEKWFDVTNCGLGHRRLSIIDLSPSGHQPMCNKSANLWITYNGEVYNYKQIRADLEDRGHQFFSHSDTEVVLKAYEEWGAECLFKLNGMFAFAIYDQQKDKLFAARDRIGIKPFYYYNRNESFVFASEIKALLVSGLVPKEPDYASLFNPTRYQISPFTGFVGINKLPPGHYLTFQDNKLEIRRYWEIAPKDISKIDFQDAHSQLDSLLSDSVDLQMVSDVPVGVFLSGGLDSSIITALMTKGSNTSLSSFTIRFKDNDQKFENMPKDDFFAQKVAALCHTDHHEIEINPKIVELLPKMVYHLDEPLADPAAINTYLISKGAREAGISVLLNGMGGDEIFGGYRKQLACLYAERYQRYLPLFLRRGLERLSKSIPSASSSKGFRTVRWGKRFLSFAALPQLERFLASDLSLLQTEFEQFYLNPPSFHQTHFYQQHKHYFADDALSYLTKMCLDDTSIFLPEHNLTYSDKASMAAGVESRPPLTDHRIVEFMFNMPAKMRIHSGEQKYLLKKVSEKYLPKEIVYRPKAPFGAPLRSWVRHDLKEMVDDLLSPERLRRRKLFNEKKVESVIQEDRKGFEDRAHIIWQLLTTELWFSEFFG